MTHSMPYTLPTARFQLFRPGFVGIRDAFSTSQSVEQLAEIGRQWHCKRELFAGDGVDETYFRGMQGQPRSSAFIGNRLARKRSAVDLVATQGMPRLREMNADLMSAPRFQPAFDDRVTLESLDRF